MTDPTRWVDEYGDVLFHFALARVRNPQHAEDLVQETLLAALQARHRFAGRSAERTWLVSILKHKVADHFRRAGRTYSLDEAMLPAQGHEDLFDEAGAWKQSKAPTAWSADPAEALAQDEFLEVLRACLSRLPSRMAQVFWMREVDGLRSDEICGLLDISANNLWVLLHRARLQLRHCLAHTWFQ